jgi:hypothetical protein
VLQKGTNVSAKGGGMFNQVKMIVPLRTPLARARQSCRETAAVINKFSRKKRFVRRTIYC